jgi:hypothetical protein
MANPRVHSKSVAFRFAPDAPLSGIVACLWKIDGVVVTASSSYSDSPEHGPRNIADFADPSWFSTKNEPNPWVCYDFGDKRVRLSHYTIRSQDWDQNHPKNWNLEGSVDGDTWIELDRRERISSLDGELRVATFQVTKTADVRMVRLVATGLNTSGTRALVLSAMEVFGEVFEP